MDYKMLCPMTIKECTSKSRAECSNSNCNAIFVHQSLIKVVEMLIQRNVGVTDTDVRCSTAHNLKITINLAGAVPYSLFNDLPKDWELVASKTCRLCCCEINPDDSDSNHIIYSNMISSLEDWLESKDIDGFKALLMLSEYSTGQ
jgi:hypothetical protein